MTHNSDPQNRGVITRSSSSIINLVSCSSEHSLLAIKRGSVAKVPNTDAQGRPTFRFKNLSSIYKHEDASNMHSVQTFGWQANRSEGSSGECQVKLEPTSPEECNYLDKSNNNDAIDDSESRLHKNDSNLQTNHDCDELNGMTLKELKIRLKKQKTVKFDVSGEADAKSNTLVSQCRRLEHASIEPVEVESDLEEPLTVLKEKLSKRFKLERKRRKCAHPYSSDSVVSRQELHENKQSSNAAQCFTFIDDRSSERAHSMDNTTEFHLKSIKEEGDSQSVAATAEFSASVSMPEHCMVPQVSEEAQWNELGVGGSASGSCILNCSMYEVSSPEAYRLSLEIGENSTEIYCDSLSSIQEWDLCRISSPEMAYSVKEEIMEHNFLSEQEAITTGHFFTGDFTAESPLSGKSLDAALNWKSECKIENVKPPPAERSPCSSVDDLSIKHPLLYHQISLQESGEKNFDVIKSLFSPLMCTSGPVSRTADHGSELPDSSKSMVRVEEIMLEAFDPIKEQHDAATCCTREICSKADNSICAPALNRKCEDDNNSTFEMPLQKTSMSSIVSNDISSMKGEISASISKKELAGEMPTDDSGKVYTLQPSEHFKSEACATYTSRNSSRLSSSANCLHSIDACLDVTEERTMATVEGKFEDSTFSSGILKPVDVEGLEAAERQQFLSQNSDQLSGMDEILHVDSSLKKIHEISFPMMEMFSIEGGNRSAEISFCNDVDRHKEDETPNYSLEHPPIKLLSNRKALSPTSQEKLCQAVVAETDKVSNSTKKLLFEKRTNNSSPPKSGCTFSELMSSPERMKFSGTGKWLSFEKRVNCNSTSESGHRIQELMLSPEKASKRPKNGSVPPSTKGILKSPFPMMKPCLCMESSLICKHTQEAITFSQRQMHDIEALAMKLVKGLMSMKSIVEAALNTETCLSEYNADQMRMAMDNASELDDTTKRWLSMMGRDCNRFCKILRSTVCKTTAPNDGLRKERKKITFADEAGGTLCHVKVFEGHTSSSVELEHEEVDQFPPTTVQ